MRGICTACAANYEVALETCQIICGDGLFDIGEVCDDGNTAIGDGCSGVCLVEGGYTCDGNFPTTCSLTNPCGNGILNGLEVCDDGN